MAGSRRQYPFDLIEPKWQAIWDRQQTFRAWNPGEVIPAEHPFAVRHKLSGKVAASQMPPKHYVLDMFPYPSGAGLHVGHPEGYTATDILARYRRAQGFNVLHPMGWDAFGLPAEQYAIKTGQHPRKTTEENIATFKRQIKSLGFSYDWTREVDTTDPNYFKWTQWIFLKLYNSYFDEHLQKAMPIELLEDAFSDNPKRRSEWAGNAYLDQIREHGYERWRKDETEEQRDSIRREFLKTKRLAYVTEAPVWWCEELGTVLANEEVVDGKSEVGGHPVVRKPMRQWMLRITKYAERLLSDLDSIDWSHSLKEMQRNWIGRSDGAEVDFEIAGCGLRLANKDKDIRVFTTRPDTLFGATYMVLAPEHKFVDALIKYAKTEYPVNGKIVARRASVVDSECKVLGIKPLQEAFALVRDRNVDLVQLGSLGEMAVCLAQDYGEFRFSQQEAAKQIDGVVRYREEVAKKSDLERTELAKEKTGVFTGAYAINPVNQEKIPIWIADYVLASYGTGAIMAVPAHDERDWEFAKKFGLPIKQVVAETCEETILSETSKEITPTPEGAEITWTTTSAVKFSGRSDVCFAGEGFATNSSNEEISLDTLPTPEAKKQITAWLEEKGLGKKTINFKLRDWLFSRQRYWGEPFPIVWRKGPDSQSYHEALPESALPVLPPKLDDYKPTPDGQPPLARAQDWVNLPDGSTRETNTMPQWAGSCWYYLRYLDATNANAFVGKEAEKYWMGGESPKSNAQSPKSTTPGVDLYVGGTEHAVLHLLYARFWHKVLYDLGYVSTPEPFFKLVNQGIILGEDNQKMSKARGNVVNPDDMVRDFGADALRLYEMFMGPLEMVKPWSTKGVEGVYRFLGRVWRLFVDEQSQTEFEQSQTTDAGSRGRESADLLDLIKLNPAIKDVQPTPAQLKTLHACIKKVTEDLDGLRFNTAISAMMVFVNEAMTWETKPRSMLRDFLILLQPFAPHIAEELWSKVQDSESKVQSPTSNVTATSGRATLDIGHWTLDLAYQPWPKYDPALLVEDTLEIPVQVNGKLRDVIRISANATQAEIEAGALASEKVKPFLEGKTVKKIIVVPKRLVNIAVSG